MLNKGHCFYAQMYKAYMYIDYDNLLKQLQKQLTPLLANGEI